MTALLDTPLIDDAMMRALRGAALLDGCPDADGWRDRVRAAKAFNINSYSSCVVGRAFRVHGLTRRRARIRWTRATDQLGISGSASWYGFLALSAADLHRLNNAWLRLTNDPPII